MDINKSTHMSQESLISNGISPSNNGVVNIKTKRRVIYENSQVTPIK